ncbi:xyloglucan endotransglucosylase/hydrolase protein 3-like [Miscanthus floridulus]|uniref:xyloglucan endotransglucosylase/hydrolase protein 3-like n=1 Tax=Miscanthus floridulus TaxID=154761 RepID=UPI003458625C
MASEVRAWLLLLVLLTWGAILGPAAGAAPAPPLNVNYVKDWGRLVDHGTEVDLILDQSTAARGGGFKSKSTYGSGFFHLRMKLPSGYTAGVVTTFYLISQPEDGTRDEVDFEFLGDKAGVPITLQTNFFVNGHGQREQRLHLWFDPSADFHDYKILWNPYLLVMFVDETPIRVLRNLRSTVPGYEFPTKPMLIRASIWDGSSWATDGGRTKVDWSKAPFTAGYQGFDVNGCATGSGTPCDSPGLWWNGAGYRDLSAQQRAAYEGVKKKYMISDYCANKKSRKIECSYAWWTG